MTLSRSHGVQGRSTGCYCLMLTILHLVACIAVLLLCRPRSAVQLHKSWLRTASQWPLAKPCCSSSRTKPCSTKLATKPQQAARVQALTFLQGLISRWSCSSGVR